MNPLIKVLFFGMMLVGYAGLVYMASDAGAFASPMAALDWWLPLKAAVFLLPLYILLVAWRHKTLVNTDFLALIFPMSAWFVAFYAAQLSGWWRIWCQGTECEYAGKGEFNFFIVEPPLVLLLSGAYLARFLVMPLPSSLIKRLLISIISVAVLVAWVVPALPD